jgi:carbonic anhydrase
MTTCSDTNPSLNVPRDITVASASKCEQKCLYWYNYAAPSTCLVANEGDRLTIQYDGGGDVTFNTMTFTPSTVRIFSPSLHKFNGNQTAAELIVQHSSKSSSMDGLLVCIPIVTVGELTAAGQILDTIIEGAPPEENTSATVTVADFNLNNMIPKSGYFTYTGPLPYDTCVPTGNYQYVVFHPLKKGTIAITPASLSTLQSIIHFSYIVATEGNDVFFNSKGTSSNGFNGDGQIYIQCQPVGQSSDEVVYKESSGGSSSGSVDYKKYATSFLALVVGVLICYAALKIVNKVISSAEDLSSGAKVSAPAAVSAKVPLSS